MKPRVYQPVLGPQHRRRLLRELSRETGRERFSVSPREVRRSVGKMFGFRPLTSMGPFESAMVRRYAKNLSKSTISSFVETSHGLLSGKATALKDFNQKEGEKVGRHFTRDAFSKAQEYENTIVREIKPRMTVTRNLQLQGSRSLHGYLREGHIDVAGLILEAQKRKKGRVRLLDVGSATGRMLQEVKQRFGDSVELHALSPEDEPKHSGFHYHLLVAEYFPKSFQNAFDVIVSNRALEYTLYPDIALQNISKSLAVGGKAHIQWTSGRSAVHGGPELLRAYDRYDFSNISSGLIKIFREGRAVDQLPAISNDQIKKQIRSLIQEHKFTARQEVAWCNEIARLRRTNQFTVSIGSWTWTTMGTVPGELLIERKK